MSDMMPSSARLERYRMDPDQYEKMWQLMRKFNLQFVDEIAPTYKCCICKSIIKNAAVTPCDCKFCFPCVNRYLEDGPKPCPGPSELCKNELLDLSQNNRNVTINRGMNLKISKFRTNCPYGACQWKMELNKLSDHLIICDHKPQICPFVIIGCRQDQMTRDQISHHISIDNMHHVQLMIDYICKSNNELDKLKRQLINSKSENELEKEKIRLENKKLMDKLQETIDKMKEKMRQDRQNAQYANQLLVDEINANKAEIDSLNKEMNALKHANQTMKEEMKSIKDKINQQIDIDLKQTKRIKEINELFQKTQSRSDEIHKEIKSDHKNFREKIEKISQQFDCMKTQSMITMTKLLKIVEPSIVTKKSGEIIWTIKNWANLLAKKIIIKDDYVWIKESDPFESHHQGYQMCLSGEISKYNLILYLRICNGSNDDNLDWPFHREVEISIIDQVTGDDFLTWTHDFSKVPSLLGLLKPTKEIPNEPYFLYGFPLKEISPKPNVTINNQIIVKFSSKPAIIQ